MNQNNSMQETQDAVLDAALAHVAFDGWSAATLAAAARDSGVAAGLVSALFPRGAVDLALAYHHRGDRLMREQFAAENHDGLRYSEKVARAVRLRLEAASDKEAVRRGTTLFALPQHAAEGAKAIWGTADAIWAALGDGSTDLNWYTKRATLSAVYASTVLFWLGDDSTDHQATWEFLDRRIANVMQIEKLKASVRDNPLAKAFAAGPGRLFDKIRAPILPDDLPGSFMDRNRH
jgi:ubiquinone biosynthesis protein COQ9